MDVKSAILATVLIATIIPIFPINVYAVAVVECNGNTIERGDFDSDGIDEVKVNGIVYEDGDSITLDGKTYTVVIFGISFASNGNDFIVGTDGDDTDRFLPITAIIGKGGDEFHCWIGWR